MPKAGETRLEHAFKLAVPTGSDNAGFLRIS